MTSYKSSIWESLPRVYFPVCCSRIYKRAVRTVHLLYIWEPQTARVHPKRTRVYISKYTYIYIIYIRISCAYCTRTKKPLEVFPRFGTIRLFGSEKFCGRSVPVGGAAESPRKRRPRSRGRIK